MKLPPLLVPLAALALPSLAPGQCLPVVELTPSGASGNYGSAVALHGDRAAVGAPLAHGVAGSREGQVVLWQHDGTTWVEEQTVFAADGTLFDDFGSSIDLHGDVLVVGAPLEDEHAADSGAVYVFRDHGSGWVQETKLLQPGALSLNRFGRRVALDGDVLVATGGREVLFYRYHGRIIGWQLEGRVDVDGVESSVDVQGDRAVVGQPHADGASTGDGVVLVFEFDGLDWIEAARLSSSSPDEGDRFGRDVAVDGDVVAVGAARDEGLGSVFVYEHDGSAWSEAARLLTADGIGGEFGSSVDLDGSCIVASSALEDLGYEFRKERGRWVESAVFASPSADIGFARAVAVDGDRALLGSHFDHCYEFPAASLRLTIQPAAPFAGEEIVIRTHAGLPDKVVMLYTVNVNGTPVLFPLARFRFGDDYTFTIRNTVPPGLSGLHVEFLAYGEGATGKILESNLAVVDFQ